MATSNTLPWITFTYNGATVTVQETPAGSPTIITTQSTPATTDQSSKTTESSSSASSSTSASAGKTSSSASKTTSSSSKPTSTPVSGSIPTSCIRPTATLSNLGDAQALASSCVEFQGDILIATGVSSPIDLSGMRYLNGSLIVYGSQDSRFDTLSSNSIYAIMGSWIVENTKYLSNVSFPLLMTIGERVSGHEGGLSIVNNAALHQLDSMRTLQEVEGPIDVNGSFTSLTFPALADAYDAFNVRSSEALDCAVVAPNYAHVPNPQHAQPAFSCISGNDTLTVPGNSSTNGTVITHNVPGPRGFDTKDIIIVSVIAAVVFLMAVAGFVYCYMYRRTMANMVALARASRRGSHANTPTPMPATPRTPRTAPRTPSQGFQVHRPADDYAALDPHLYRQLMELNEMAKRPGGLTEDQIHRRQWLNEELRNLAARARHSGYSQQ